MMQNIQIRDSVPKLIPDTGFNRKLNITEHNREHTRAFLAKGTTDFVLPGFITPHGYRLVKSTSGNEQYRLVTSTGEPETAYAVKLAFMNHIVPGKKTCTQIMVWRSLRDVHDTAVNGLAKAFFAYFLGQYQIVVSDSEQTADGRRFWEFRIAWAIGTPDYHVYVSDGTEEDRPLTRIDTISKFFNVWSDFCYSYDPDCHSHRLLIISTEDLL